MNSPSSEEKIFQPSRMCRVSSSALYWVSTKIRRMLELTQFDSVKSMMR